MTQYKWWGMIAGLALCAGAALAQEQPIQPIGQPPSPDTSQTETWTPDTKPVTGAEKLGLGSSESSANKIYPTFRFTQMFDSNALVAPGRYSYDSVSTLGGTFSMSKNSAHRVFTLDYNGGALIYAQRSDLNTSFHSLNASQKFSVRRWTFLMSDSFSYTPEAVNGISGAFGGLTTGVSDLVASMMPNGSVLTLHSGRYSNSSVFETDYRLGKRDALTFNGSYALMHFTATDLLNGNQMVTGAGYNHSFNAHDAIGFGYQNSLFKYDASSTSIMTHSMTVNFAHRLMKRTMVHLAAGPQISDLNGATLKTRQLNYTIGANAERNFGRTTVAASYNRMVTGGSGVFLGSRINSIGANLSRSFSRTWSLELRSSYNRNTQLTGITTVDTVTSGVSLDRNFRRGSSMYFAYDFQRQVSGATCTNAVVCADLNRHVFTFGFTWALNPVALK